MNSGQSTIDREKLEQVILFFLERINNTTLGRTKLMKLLYFVDFGHYQKTGRSITNAKYRKLPHGPIPDKADKLIQAMIKKNAAKEVKTTLGHFVQHRLLTNSLFDASRFSGDEIQTLISVAQCWEQATADEIATATHREAPWATTEEGKAIDYELANYRSLPSDDEPEDGWLAKSKEFSEIVSGLA